MLNWVRYILRKKYNLNHGPFAFPVALSVYCLQFYFPVECGTWSQPGGTFVGDWNTKIGYFSSRILQNCLPEGPLEQQIVIVTSKNVHNFLGPTNLNIESP